MIFWIYWYLGIVCSLTKWERKSGFRSRNPSRMFELHKEIRKGIEQEWGEPPSFCRGNESSSSKAKE